MRSTKPYPSASPCATINQPELEGRPDTQPRNASAEARHNSSRVRVPEENLIMHHRTPAKLHAPTASSAAPRRRGRPLRHPENDLRTPQEIQWWNTNVAEPLAAKRRPLPLARTKLADAWLYDAPQLFKELDGVRAIILAIPETPQTRSALQSAIDRIWRLQQDLRYLLSLQRDGQRAFAKKHHTDTPPGKRATAATTTHHAPARMAKRASAEHA